MAALMVLQTLNERRHPTAGHRTGSPAAVGEGLDKCPVSALILSFPCPAQEDRGAGSRSAVSSHVTTSQCLWSKDIRGNYIHFVQKFRNEPHMKLLEIWEYVDLLFGAI